eukprot:181903-Chlamydomonas_euryale.AAC.1
MRALSGSARVSPPVATAGMPGKGTGEPRSICRKGLRRAEAGSVHACASCLSLLPKFADLSMRLSGAYGGRKRGSFSGRYHSARVR